MFYSIIPLSIVEGYYSQAKYSLEVLMAAALVLLQVLMALKAHYSSHQSSSSLQPLLESFLIVQHRQWSDYIEHKI